MMKTEIGIGIVGAGRIFEQHAIACSALTGRARLLAVSDIDENQMQKATRQYSIPLGFTDHRKLLEQKEIDAVIVCTPPSLHEQVVDDALEAGKFVICEKPLAHTLESADRIVAMATKHPGKLSTVYQFRYLPEVQRTLWLRDQGRLGSLLFGRFSRFAKWEAPARKGKDGSAKPAKKRSAWWGQWETAGGGMVMTQLIHELDLMCHIFGRATEVTATIDTLQHQIESEDSCIATIRFENGAMVTCYGTMTAQRSNHGFDVIGDKASSHFPWAVESLDTGWRDDSLRSVLEAYPLAQKLETPKEIRQEVALDKETKKVKGPATSAHTPYLEDVVNAIIEARPLPIGAEDARASLEICTAIYSSALSGHAVLLPLDHTNNCYAGLTTALYDGGRRIKQQKNNDALEPIQHMSA
jgi:UDP-N-acetyl-2-amino-2-deoxyglucuronate dehydrogenase